MVANPVYYTRRAEKINNNFASKLKAREARASLAQERF
ncbi:hypothetical protein HM1_1756 [Heliomicrobium modesticaldum Ice1]|uniref:Uncharacterized protein n=1 Tax=Heliobacterium modesticaldum (strain ATCC 51547 / Ice1) TaxID=498761 RepID=B0TES4_HELMI|nr:hypothetical protein HM1_1756 [Heliomicrobium modesticaldum Ice1]